MKIDPNLENTESNWKFKTFFEKLTEQWFTFLEYFIISSLLFYLYSLDHKWYILVLGALSNGLLSIRISTLIFSLFFKITRNKEMSFKHQVILISALALIIFILVWGVIYLIIPDLAKTYIG